MHSDAAQQIKGILALMKKEARVGLLDLDAKEVVKSACWCFLCPIRIDILQAHKITTVALHLGVFRGIVKYPQRSTMVKAYRESY